MDWSVWTVECGLLQVADNVSMMLACSYSELCSCTVSKQFYDICWNRNIPTNRIVKIRHPMNLTSAKPGTAEGGIGTATLLLGWTKTITADLIRSVKLEIIVIYPALEINNLCRTRSTLHWMQAQWDRCLQSAYNL